MTIANRRAGKAPEGALTTLLFCSLLIICVALVLERISFFSTSSLFSCLFVWALISILVWKKLMFHNHRCFGIANTITCIRAVFTALLFGVVMIAYRFEPTSAELWYLVVIAVLTLSMDGLDGWLARKTQLSSEFGARFDMEIDALMIMVLTLLVWQSGITGGWILALGLMRYVFLAASTIVPALSQPLFSSTRRKVVCVIQVAALCLILSPLTQSWLANIIGIFALGSLVVSFAIDTIWLLLANEKTRHNTGKEKTPANKTINTNSQLRPAIRTRTKPGKQPSNEISA